MEPTRLVVLRHGETAWNAAGRIQGGLDVPLNETGHRQAKRLARALKSESFAAIHASDLQRAAQTASYLGRTTGTVITSDVRLRERHFGAFEGSTFEDIAAQFPEDAARWRKREPEWSPPGGGESLLALRERVAGAVTAIAAAHAGAQIAVVAHGGVLDVLHRLATRQPPDAPRTWELPNCAINRLLWTGEGFTLVGWGDVRHLEDGAPGENNDNDNDGDEEIPFEQDAGRTAGG